MHVASAERYEACKVVETTVGWLACGVDNVYDILADFVVDIDLRHYILSVDNVFRLKQRTELALLWSDVLADNLHLLLFGRR